MCGALCVRGRIRLAPMRPLNIFSAKGPRLVTPNAKKSSLAQKFPALSGNTATLRAPPPLVLPLVHSRARPLNGAKICA